MKALKATRRVKLQSKYRPAEEAWQPGKEVPWLNVSGVWLATAGFTAGQQVEISIKQGQLVITNGEADGNR